MTSDINNACLINGVQYKCRTCFDPGRIIHSLTDEASTTKTWHQVLKDIAQLQAKHDELLPKTLCCNCLQKLKQSYEFVLQIQAVNKKYLDLLLKEEVSNEVDNSTDCLAESTIALPLDDIKLEEEMVVSYDINMSSNLEEGDETNYENQDYDDPFNETIDEDYKEENESAIEITGKRTTKRNRPKKIRERAKLRRDTVKRTRKSKQSKEIAKASKTDETENTDDNDVKERIFCGKCTQTFSTKHAYQRHQQAEHSSEESTDEKNKCPICSKEFSNKFYIVDHIKVVHDKLRPFKCSHCAKCFASAASKRIHELTHTDDFPYVCEFCDKRFRLSSKLKIHSEIHTTKPELLCPICKRSKKSQEELEVHIKKHDDNRLQCPSCGHLFRKKSNLNDHYNAVHLKLRPYKCEICELSFGDRKTRRVHQRSHYKKDSSIAKAKSGKSATKRNRGKKLKQSDDKKEVFRNPVKRPKKAKQPKKSMKASHTHESNETQNINEDEDVKETIICDKCSQTFASIHTYQRHQQAEHSSESNEEKNKCPICSKEFRNSWYVVDHIKVVHDKLKPYKCSHCPKSFASAHSKRIHELTHTDSFPYACEYCERRFRLSSKLKIHSEIHTTKPELLCPICKRSQKSQEELELHVKNHDDNRLQCPSCGNLFRRNAQLKDHYNAVHLKLRPYKCEFCELGFGDRKTRRVHQRTHHKQQLPMSYSSSTKKFEAEFPFRCTYNFSHSQSVKQRTRGQPFPQDELIEKINENCFLCLVCKKTLTLLRNCRRHVVNMHSPQAINGAVKTPTERIRLNKNLQQLTKYAVDMENPINTNDSTLQFGNRIYSEPVDWRLVECKLCSATFETCETLRQHLENHTDIDTLHSLKLSDNVVQHLFPNMNNLKLIKQNICKDIRKKHWFKYYTVLNEHFYEMSVSDTEVDELVDEPAERSNKYNCALCPREFAYKYQVYAHLKQAHNSEKIPFKCGRCKLEFVSIKMYTQHLQTHCKNKHKRLLCNNCPGKFVWTENIKKHNCITGFTATSPTNFEDQCKGIQNNTTGKSSNFVSISPTATAIVINENCFQDQQVSETDLDKTPALSNEAMQNINNFECIRGLDVSSESVYKQPTAETEKKIVCSFCCVSFSDHLKLRAHTKKCHTNEKTFKCSLCEMAFVRATDLESHRLTHPGEHPFKCMFCEKSFERRAQLQGHKRAHKDKIYKCTICTKSFKGSNHLKEHFRIHSDKILFKCDICLKSFVSSSYLGRHRELMGHYESWSTTNNISNSEGLENSTLVKKKKMLCPICGVYLSKNTSFSQHMRTHTGDKPHKCEFCEMAFIRKSDLRNHRRTHTAERPFKCPHCEKSFINHQRLKNHIRIHTGERPFQCTFCNKAFSISERLKLHLRCHTGEKPFQCDICGQAYTCRPYLKKHRIAKGHFTQNK